MIRLLFILATIISINTFAQETSLPVDEWKSSPVPVSPDSLLKYNYSKTWFLSIKNDEVFATTTEGKTATAPFLILEPTPAFDQFYRYVAKVDDGYLIGFNGGEFGGSLYWYSKDGERFYKVSNHSVIQYIKRGNKLYAIEGLTHMSVSEGSIIELKKISGKWTAERYVELPLGPTAVALDKKGSFIVMTSSSLLRINKNKRVTTLIDKGFWAIYLYPGPESIKVKNDTFYVGLRGGVFKYNPATKKQEWLMPY
ncbi:hypothetical protein [Pedobacter frigoris]|uniref:hypothetical protein n=1 Tax=Pedobacter frigoris TaxID=2571272 RepID=UPI00292FE04C|nr:hypothetical protein [Pedobacter frigoris]